MNKRSTLPVTDRMGRNVRCSLFANYYFNLHCFNMAANQAKKRKIKVSKALADR